MQTSIFRKRPSMALLLVRLSSQFSTFQFAHGFGLTWSSHFFGLSSRSIAHQTRSRHVVPSASIVSSSDTVTKESNHAAVDRSFMIHWRGESNEEYSIQFRHLEFTAALQAVMDERAIPNKLKLEFEDALLYTGIDDNMPEEKVSEFNEAMQYVRVLRDVTTSDEITQLDFVRATQRCSLVHALYQVVSRSDSYEGLSEVALQNGNMIDMQPGKENQNATWCFRVRHYGQASGTKKQKRHGDRTRSVSQERIALKEMTPLFMTFGGAVDLENPDCKLYVFDGVKPIPEQKQEDTKILTRQIATGPQIYRIAPNTRICVTNTPLCPIASYLLCNAAGIRPGQAVLDPFGGSCATLLAASMIANVRSVSIEIAHNGYVNRDDILLDFETRQLTPPLALIHGDSTDPTVREKARQVLLDDDPKLTEQEISSGAFDCIVTDPPYGIRESTTSDETNPIQDLLLSIEYDRDVVGKRLLKKGGKLVAFLPCTEEQSFEDDAIPSSSELERAGLRISQMREQKLNDVLSRWLVVFDCVT